MKYQVEVRETLARIIVVDAPTEEDALKLVGEKIEADEIELDSSDYADREIEILDFEVPDYFEVDYTVIAEDKN